MFVVMWNYTPDTANVYVGGFQNITMASDQAQPRSEQIEIGREIWNAGFLLTDSGVGGEIGDTIHQDVLKAAIVCLKYSHPEYQTTQEEMEMLYDTIEPYSRNWE